MQSIYESSILTTVYITNVVPEYTVTEATVAYQKYCCNKYETADGARFALQEKANHVK